MVLLPNLTSGCLVLGLGNPFLGDDCVGHLVAESLKGRLAGLASLSVRTTSFAGIRLLDQFLGYDRLILIDSITTGLRPPGSLHLLRLSDIADAASPISAHHFSIARLLDLGKRWSLHVPGQVTIYAVEIEPPALAGEALSPAIEAAIEPIAREILCREFPAQATRETVAVPRGEESTWFTT